MWRYLRTGVRLPSPPRKYENMFVLCWRRGEIDGLDGKEVNNFPAVFFFFNNDLAKHRLNQLESVKNFV